MADILGTIVRMEKSDGAAGSPCDKMVGAA
jgi:hypothetical protein